MSVDATVCHVFGYDGNTRDSLSLQLADETTLVVVSGHTLHFTSSLTRSQHFLLSSQPRRIGAFDFNWKTSTFALAAREPQARISLYSYPDKKPKAQLEAAKDRHDQIFEYLFIKFSRCGRRLLSLRPASLDQESHKGGDTQDYVLCVWDVETLAPIPGCEHSTICGSVRFASFDPSNYNQVIVGGDNGLKVLKLYTGKTAASSLLRAETVIVSSLAKDEKVGQFVDTMDVAEWEERRKQVCCHAWLPRSRLLVANQAGDLLLVDATEAKVLESITTATRRDRCVIAGIVVTIETLVVAYSDGALAWFQLNTWEILNTDVLPGIATNQTVTVMTPTPSYAKAYVGTRNGQIFEIRTNVLQDEDDDVEKEESNDNTHPATSRQSDQDEIIDSAAVVPFASFPTGPVCDSTVLTPFGGTFSTDALIATGGVNGRLALWGLLDRRLAAEVNIAAVFSQNSATIRASAASASRPGTAKTVSNDVNEERSAIPPSVVIAALASRPGDPIVIIGDHQGRLRSLCVSKVIGGGGKVEVLPQHSVQLLPTDAPLDQLSIHSSQPVLMVSSTHSGVVFLLSLDHEKRFSVVAFLTLQEPNERVLDCQWTSSTSSTSTSLTLTCFSSRGVLYNAQYHAPLHENISVGSAASGYREISPRSVLEIVPKVIALGEDILSSCARLRFLTGFAPNMMIATSPSCPEITLLSYHDTVHKSTKGTKILSRSLTKRGHSRGISALSIFPHVLDGGVELLATGGMDGTVTLWTLATTSAVLRRQVNMSSDDHNTLHEAGAAHEIDELQATKKRTLVLHAGAVTTLRFVLIQRETSSELGGHATIQLISTGVDGCVFLMDVRLSAPLQEEPLERSNAPSSDRSTNPLYMNVVSNAKYDDIFQPEREQERTPFLQVRSHAQAIVAHDRFDRGKESTRAKLRELEDQLKVMLAENEQLPADEQLAREEFVLNVTWHDKLRRQHTAQAQRIGEGIKRDLARMAIVRERMKREFWDVTEVSGLRLNALSPLTSPASVPVNQQTQQPLVSVLEPLFVYNFPMRRQTPREEKLAKQIAMLRMVEYVHHQQEDDEGLASDARTRFHETISSNVQWVLNAGSLHPKSQLRETRSGGVPTSPEVSTQVPSFCFVYHPAAVRTRNQFLVQMHLLHSYALALQRAFNTDFETLVRHKESTMEQIDAKNARIMEISTELNVSADLFRPQWTPEEKADSVLKVLPHEMTQLPYETTERRKQRERETQDAVEREKARKKNDVGGRALIDMMDGTLDIKKDPLAAREVVKETWMSMIPLEDMTVEQKKVVAQFEASQVKFEEEREKYRKSLDLELRRIRGEIGDLCRAFDDKLRALGDQYIATRRAVLAQELCELRLAEELSTREQLERDTARFQDRVRALQEVETRAQAENDRFAAQLEACREDAHHATEQDKVLEKTFGRDLEDMVRNTSKAGGGTAIASTNQLESPEFMKHLMELYHKRKPDDLVAFGNDAIKRPASATLRAKGSAKQRLLAETQGSEGGSSRRLLSKQASNKSNAVESEGHFDPFQSLDKQRQSHSRRASVKVDNQTLVVTPLDYALDRPEGVLIDDRIWRAVNTLRAQKILAEHATSEKLEVLALAKTVSDELRKDLADIKRRREKQQQEHERLYQRRTALMESAPLLVCIKQGQDETFVDDESSGNALLVARTSVEALNDVIQVHGKDQVSILSRIKDFRKSINVMEWKHALLELQARDMEERYTDIQLLRVTKDLQQLLQTGDNSHKQKRQVAMLEAKLAHLGRQKQTSLLKLERTGSHLERQLRERERENQSYQQQVTHLETQVQIREDILASRTSTQQVTGDARRENVKLKAIAVRRKLVDLAKAQTEEIDFLRLELDKMRRRTFPSFARREYHDVD